VLKAGMTTRQRAVYRLPHFNELAMLPTYVTRAWADGVLDLRHALLTLREEWADIAAPGTPCPIEFSPEEMAEHRRQLESFKRYEAAIQAVHSMLEYEGDGLVNHESYDAAQQLIGRLEGTWDENVTESPFPIKDGEYSYFLS
jgi:hypothetical protein